MYTFSLIGQLCQLEAYARPLFEALWLYLIWAFIVWEIGFLELENWFLILLMPSEIYLDDQKYLLTRPTIKGVLRHSCYKGLRNRRKLLLKELSCNTAHQPITHPCPRPSWPLELPIRPHPHPQEKTISPPCPPPNSPSYKSIRSRTYCCYL